MGHENSVTPARLATGVLHRDTACGAPAWGIIRRFLGLRRRTVVEWQYAQADPSDELAQLSYYSMKKRQDGRDIEFRITVKEFVQRPAGQHSRFFAEADKHVNQKTAAVLPH